METIQMSINGRVNKQMCEYSYIAIPHNTIKEQTINAHNSIDESLR